MPLFSPLLRPRTRPRCALLPTLLLAAAACSDKGGDDTDTAVDPDSLPGTAAERAACALVTTAGPTVAPSNQLTAQAPALQELGSPYTVQLAQAAGGYVRLTADAGSAGPRAVFFGLAEAVGAVIAEDGTELPFSPAAGTACPESIPARIDLEMPIGTVFLRFDPSPYPSVWVLTDTE